jgi:hypothetical protein
VGRREELERRAGVDARTELPWENRLLLLSAQKNRVTLDRLEKERRAEQSQRAAHSSRGKLRYVAGGHEIEIDAPSAVVEAIRSMVIEWRHDKEKQNNARESVKPEQSRMR